MSESVEGYITGKAIVADPFMHLSSAPEKQAEKFSRCISTFLLEDVDIIGVESISVVSQSSSEFAINEYGTNFGKISINKLEMSRSKFPNISSDQAESSLRRPGKDPVEDPDTQESDIREEDIDLSSEDTDEEILEDINIGEQVIAEERADEGYNSEDDDDIYRQPLQLSDATKVVKVKVDPVWLKTASEKNYCNVGRRFYRLPDDYALTLPKSGDTVIDCPEGHIVVYAKHFEFGLRFPLHPFVEKIFKAWNVCIAQVTPTTIRNVISLVWVMIYMDFPLTLNLIRKLHWLKKDSQSLGWWSLYTVNGKVTVWPKLTSCKKWQGQFYFVKVPDSFSVRRTFHLPHTRFDSIKDRKLGPLERKAFRFFDCLYVNDGKKVKAVPREWLPNCNYILVNAPLSHIGLYNTDEYGPDKLDNEKLGLYPDDRVKRQCPPNPKGKLDTLPKFATRAQKGRQRSMQDMTALSRPRSARADVLPLRRGGGVVWSKRRSSASDRDQSKKQKTTPVTGREQDQTKEAAEFVNLDDDDATIVPETGNHGSEGPVQQPPRAQVERIIYVSQEVPYTSTGHTGALNAFTPASVPDFIEVPHVRVPQEVADELLNFPVGNASEAWLPQLNVNRGESVYTDDPSSGGSLGWRMLKDLPTPADRTSARFTAPCSQMMNSILRTVNSVVEVVHMYKHYQRQADKAEMV
uniref:Uncharacterized protein n=1 Tax=Chenopodium quinoa TaxID=63459 RepID=A0A803LGI3_CHEQI